MKRAMYMAAILVIIASGLAIDPIRDRIKLAKDSQGRDQIKIIGMLQQTRRASFGEYYTDDANLKSDSRIDTQKHILILSESDIPHGMKLPDESLPFLKPDAYRFLLLNLNDDGSPRSYWILDSNEKLSHHFIK